MVSIHDPTPRTPPPPQPDPLRVRHSEPSELHGSKVKAHEDIIQDPPPCLVFAK